MTSTAGYLKEWQAALKAEIIYMKRIGSNKYRVSNGRRLQRGEVYTYFFDTSMPVKIPVGSRIKVQWGEKTTDGRILSSEGKNVIIELTENLGDLLSELTLIYDPWELLDELFNRLEEIKSSKRKRNRIKRLMDPSMEAKHPSDHFKSNVHELILRSKYNPVTYVWGPPGTGKTYTLARVAANKYFKNQKVLVLAHSNQAVDVLMAETSLFIENKKRLNEGDLIRYGSQTGDALEKHRHLTSQQLMATHHQGLADQKEALLEERRLIKLDLSTSFSKRDSNQLIDIEKKLGSVMEKIRQKEIEFVKDAKVIGTTLAKAARDPIIFEAEFDIVIVDEASMAYVPQAAFAASLGKRVIICGDFKQLPPIAASRHQLVNKWLREDIFHHSGVANWVSNGTLHPHLFLLKEQRRMHPDISAFTNKHIYYSLVGDHPSVGTKRNDIADRKPFSKLASILVDSSGAGQYCMKEKNSHSRINIWQLLLAFQLVHEAYLEGNRSIGYVTPYRSQALLMEQFLQEVYEMELQSADITSATVHRFQGSEREVMIFDSVDSTPQERPGMLLIGKDSDRLLNVAITRTKGKFIHISDLSFIQSRVSKNKILRALAEHQLSHQQVVFPNEIGSWVKHMHPNLKWMYARKLDDIKADLETAKNSIIICLPDSTHISKEWIQMINERKGGVELIILSDRSVPQVNGVKWGGKPLSFPFVLIDKSLIWIGAPLEASIGVLPPYIAARLQSRLIGDFLLQQTDMSDQ
ncbi:AAA domain-containing protein [Cytobacillus purgationiresistens]|uniref:AAA+ ATPase domain-containing protein n=1 Tax=Cytobacillus purgationiresistens TaxID=863449 RepID=A0ABU0AB29_9BACI|nr:AAA domain-containing protein [Cytobacillus purgationiresistens]MDQ0268456.1 hypothetical protein [Cytobacillus purgationiresistens]